MTSQQKKGSLTNCVVLGCHNTYRNTADRLPKVQFYIFPSSIVRRNDWSRLVNRQNEDGSDWIPSKHSRICSDHFVSGVESNIKNHPSYNPSIHPVLSMSEVSRRENESNDLQFSYEIFFTTDTTFFIIDTNQKTKSLFLLIIY